MLRQDCVILFHWLSSWLMNIKQVLNKGMLNTQLHCVIGFDEDQYKRTEHSKLFADVNGDPSEVSKLHFVIDDDDSQSIGSDLKSLFGSLIASDNDLTDDEFAEGEVRENEKGSDLSDDETLARTDSTSSENDLNSKETGVDSSEDDENEEINSISKNFNLNLNIKEKLNEYRKLALEPHVASDEAKEQVAAALSNHTNPVSCPVCKALVKNERSVKFHIAKKHS
ncbi:hypothetical protein BpHYR1_039227 [Brachionus plicatilis]|uniref:Uncharacterized protein n=1 Tax=Brachionus plicatilis TaxID=10195 RepID=A0A3M7R6I1_BRAPC|nr:hypothetical protein BpHYR1_039227 [Brachionus plicatilis]